MMRHGRSNAAATILLLAAAIAASSVLSTTHAFAPTTRAFSFAPSIKHASPLSSSSSSKDEQESKTTTYEPLSENEIEQLLSRVPVYAITDTSSGGVVLMSERNAEGGEEEGVAYLFMTRESAVATMKQLQGSIPGGSNWEVTGLSLGAIWYELLSGESQVQSQSVTSGEIVDTTNESIDYRLVPDYRDLNGARYLLSQTPEAEARLEKSGFFASAYGDIPVFMDLQVRMEEQQEDGCKVEKFPMYLALQDMVETCQQFIDAQADAGATYEASINVAQLKGLVEKMQKPSTVDFRNAVLIPPTPLPDEAIEVASDSSFVKSDAPENGYSPTMNDNWED